MTYKEYVSMVNSISVRVDYKTKLGAIYVNGNLYNCPFEIENLCHYNFTLRGYTFSLLIHRQDNKRVLVTIDILGADNVDPYGNEIEPIDKLAEITSIPFEKNTFEKELGKELEKYDAVSSLVANDIVTFFKRTDTLFKENAIIEDIHDSMCGGIAVVGVLNGYAVFDSNEQFDTLDTLKSKVDIDLWEEQGLVIPVEDLDNESVIRLYRAYLGLL